ncbi:MAG: ATP-binding protein [Ruminococcus sp.]|nr:ATP-binding protein [Ruminococcus sp.]
MPENISSIIKKSYQRVFPLQVISILVAAVNTMIDSVITGRYIGTEGLAAIGFFVPVTTVLGISYVITIGIQIMCGKAIGCGDKKKVSSMFSTAVVSLGTFAAISSLLCNVFSEPLAAFLGADGDALSLTSAYISGYSYGITGQVISGILLFFLPLNNDKTRSYIGIGLMVTSNIALDILLVPVLGKGLWGMGIATSASYLLSSAYMLFGFLDKKRTVYLNLKNTDLSVLPEAFITGLPNLMFTVGCTAKSYIMNRCMMNAIGTDAVAVINVQNSVCSFAGAVPMGCAAAFMTLAAISYGEEDRKGYLDTFRYAMKVGVFISAGLMILIMACSNLIPALFFTQGDSAWPIARRMLLIFPSWLVFNTVFALLLKCYHIQDEKSFVNIASVSENLIIALYSALGVSIIGADAVWISFPLAEITLLLVIAVIGIRKRSWLWLNNDFGASSDQKMEFSVKNMDEVINISERIITFCEEKGISSHNSKIAGLCIEEMAGNIVTYGFADKKSHSIDVRTVIKNSELTIRIRDDCNAFDPVERMDQFTPDDPCKNIGIRMIGKLTKDISYYNTVGINTLLIKI